MDQSLLFGFWILPPFNNFPPSSYGLSSLDCTLLILFEYFQAKYYKIVNKTPGSTFVSDEPKDCIMAGSGRCRSFISKKSRKFQLSWSLLALSVNISLKKIREKVCMYCYLARVLIQLVFKWIVFNSELGWSIICWVNFLKKGQYCHIWYLAFEFDRAHGCKSTTFDEITYDDLTRLFWNSKCPRKISSKNLLRHILMIHFDITRKLLLMNINGIIRIG